MNIIKQIKQIIKLEITIETNIEISKILIVIGNWWWGFQLLNSSSLYSNAILEGFSIFNDEELKFLIAHFPKIMISTMKT